MILSGSGRPLRQGWNRQRVDADAKKAAIRELDMRSALERYGLVFNQQGAALCPFHNEKTASFRIKKNANGQFWHCFGCSETGDLINFVRRKFGLSYLDALDAIYRDFGISTEIPRISDQERLDKLRLERYNSVRRYSELIDELDYRTKVYWAAWDSLRFTELMIGGPDINNDAYVDAQYALLSARNALEQAEYDCAQYLRENPHVMPRSPEPLFTAALKVKLPPAPKWREVHAAD